MNKKAMEVGPGWLAIGCIVIALVFIIGYSAGKQSVPEVIYEECPELMQKAAESVIKSDKESTTTEQEEPEEIELVWVVAEENQEIVAEYTGVASKSTKPFRTTKPTEIRFGYAAERAEGGYLLVQIYRTNGDYVNSFQVKGSYLEQGIYVQSENTFLYETGNFYFDVSPIGVTTWFVAVIDESESQ